ncbi:MAG: CHAT domain-containing protein [Anaerolineae bacterium]|nr:CHAT domain-containing protein [Anaerolineae bacterium]
MVELDYVLLEDDLSLRALVDAVRAEGPTTRRWYTRYLIVRDGDTYLGTSLATLSVALGGGAWELDTPVTALPLSECTVIPVEEISHATVRRVSGALVAAEDNGQPVALYLGSAVRGGGRADRRSWWRLVGRRMAELGERPEWPDPAPAPFAYKEVLALEPDMTLAELAAQVVHRGKVPYLAAWDEESNVWMAYPARALLDLLANEYPDAGPSSMVGAFVQPEHTFTAALERTETPWELVEALVAEARAPGVHYLVTEEGDPAGVLVWHERMRAGSGVGSTEPQEEAWARFTEFAAHAVPTGQEPARVVNAWFADGQREPIPYTHALAANRAYQLGVNVGVPSPRAHVVGDQPPLDTRLVSYLVGHARHLVLRLDSEDFLLVDREQEVSLPRGGSTADVHFRIVTPVETGTSQMRLGVYMHNNLVQSYVIYARIAPFEGGMPAQAGDGWWTRCEYTLSSDLTNLDALQARRVCMWIGEGKAGACRGGMVASGGVDLGPSLEINASLIGAALDQYRVLLRDACLEDAESEMPVYRYQEDHTPRDAETFNRALVGLAELGQMLYERIFGTESGWRVAKRMREIERMQGKPLVVQIARLSLDLAFPWAVLYDRPFHYRPGRNQVCTRYRQEPACEETCPHAEDPSVVCVHGFWGFRYIIEQPLRPPGAFSSIATRLPAAGRPRLSMVYGPGLGLAEWHRRQIAAIVEPHADWVAHGSTEGLLQDMASAPSIVYLYCHGGNTAYRQWLVVEQDDPLMPTHLGEELRAAWSDGAPLVVLNGCHTGTYGPSTLLSFVHRFGALGAAGVIGTEIPIHESLGTAFGQFLFHRMLAGEPVGKAVYDFRWALLRQRNPLGLVYVPYCHADLQLELGERAHSST